jgi:PAS domain S-box-containing protein
MGSGGTQPAPDAGYGAGEDSNPTGYAALRAQLQRATTELETQTTYRPHAEAALAQEYRRFRAIVDMLPVHIYLKDAEGHYLTANIAKARFMGVASPEWLIGKTDADFFSRFLAEQNELVEREIRRAGRTMVDYQEISFNQETQQTTWLSTTKISLKNDEGQFIGVLSLSQDITAQKWAQEALQASEKQYRALISAMPDLIFRNKRDGTYLDYHTPGPDRLFVPPEQFLGRRLTEIFPPDVADMAMKYIELALQTGQIQHYEYPMHVVDPRNIMKRGWYPAAMMRCCPLCAILPIANGPKKSSTSGMRK